MVDHQNGSSLPYSSQRQRQQPYGSSLFPHQAPSHFHTPPRYHHHHDLHGPLSAGVVEGGHRSFTFHSTLHHHPLHSSISSPHPSAQHHTSLSGTGTGPTPGTGNGTGAGSGSGATEISLTVADILERYRDASKEFLVIVLNAKAKEDERKTEEERYKTEQIKLQAKQLELELAIEKRRGSPPTGHPYSYSSEPSSGQYQPSGAAGYAPHASVPDSSRSHMSSQPVHHDYSSQPSADVQDHAQSQQQQPPLPPKQQDVRQTRPGPPGRPPSLTINTSFRQHHPQPQSSQRLPPSPHSNLPSLTSLTVSKGRHYGLPPLNTSLQSSPATVTDIQAHIPPPPLTPKDDHVSPTSALSPTQSQSAKRKSINHEAIMDAVRAKVFRNAAGQNLQKKVAEAEREREREREREQVSSAAVARRGGGKSQLHISTTSPETPRRNVDLQPVTTTRPEPVHEEGESESNKEGLSTFPVRQRSSSPGESSPHSQPQPGSRPSSPSASNGTNDSSAKPWRSSAPNRPSRSSPEIKIENDQPPILHSADD